MVAVEGLADERQRQSLIVVAEQQYERDHGKPADERPQRRPRNPARHQGLDAVRYRRIQRADEAEQEPRESDPREQPRRDVGYELCVHSVLAPEPAQHTVAHDGRCERRHKRLEPHAANCLHLECEDRAGNRHAEHCAKATGQ